jgi:hypothetical protein
MMRTWWIPLAATLALSGLQTDAQAYSLLLVNGKSVKWTSVPVTYYISKTADAKTQAAIDAAFATWQAVPCSTLTFKKGGTFTQCTSKNKSACAKGTVHFEHATNYIYVFWVTAKAGWPYDSTGKQLDIKYASYYFTWFGMTQNLTGASIAVNAFSATAIPWSTTGEKAKLDVQNEMTPLIGGVIGLADSSVKGATMYPGMTFGDTSKQTLAKDDIDGLTYLYLKSGCTKPPPPSDGGVTTKDGGTTTNDGGTTTKDGGTTPGKDSSTPGSDSSVTTDGGVTPGYDYGGGSQCTSSSQCAADEVCTAEGFCKKIGGGGEEDDGCCRVSHARSSTGLPYLCLLGLAVLLGLARRRRRR